MPILAASASIPQSTAIQRVSLIVWNRLQMTTNTFGLWKEYLYRPSYDPDIDWLWSGLRTFWTRFAPEPDLRFGSRFMHLVGPDLN